MPLLLSGPRTSGIVTGAAHEEIVELRDLMPTLLDFAGLPIPDGVEGRSLLPVVKQPLVKGAPVVRSYLHGEHTLFGQSLQWITTDRWKYCWMSGNGHEQLFDLAADPTESHDLARDAGCREDLERLRGLLIAELDGREEEYVANGVLVAGRTPRTVLARGSAGGR
ncbi:MULTISPECIES: sulfatase/phosphatase domain-containing protein [unclassified Kitasatospora]|uniref:sulfatase/phosphatase domain-containing protein n=1 Tax=unclassified Kitasatospora TaxID=2633591 RepID=UPI00070D9582|nr:MULTISPECIES: sulfatase/phosphatase domain-containing protein [unclassified Kitasatospora]KQV12394.1 hypothetical protein ASC99_34440 [Kitasatospora sp. Root107]KRB72544.1 hypothetical protein ASE03_22085 [Kitasatospora sp. Root187]